MTFYSMYNSKNGNKQKSPLLATPSAITLLMLTALFHKPYIHPHQFNKIENEKYIL